MISQEKKEMLEYYNIGLSAYKQRKWGEAIQAFSKALEILPDDGPSRLYLERVTEFSKNPPPDDWDGVFYYDDKIIKAA